MNIAFLGWSRSRIVGWVAATLVMGVLGLSVGQATDDDKSSRNRTKTRTKNRVPGPRNSFRTNKPLPTYSDQVESHVLTFVDKHHPELRSVLMTLKEMENNSYRKAIRELEQTRAGLEMLRERQEDRYLLELEVWKIESRINLLLARYEQDPQGQDFEQQLQDLVTKQWELSVRERQYAITRLQKALENNREQLKQLQQNKDQFVESWTHKIKRSLRSSKKSMSTPRPQVQSASAPTE